MSVAPDDALIPQEGIAFSVVKNKPAYGIASVDSALLLATLLQQEGAMRVTDAATRLEVSVSTAHRLLGMLVYRDFAEQLPDRRYATGPVLRRGAVQQASVATLRDVALPHLRRLVDAVGETANVMLLAGGDVRFVATVESDQVLRVGDRTGRTLPAHLSSGGKAVLATLGDVAARRGSRTPGRGGGRAGAAGAAHHPASWVRRQRPGDRGGADRRRRRRPAGGRVHRSRTLRGRTDGPVLPRPAAGVGECAGRGRRRHRPRPDAG